MGVVGPGVEDTCVNAPMLMFCESFKRQLGTMSDREVNFRHEVERSEPDSDRQ